MYVPLQTGVLDRRDDGRYFVSRSSLDDSKLRLASTQDDALDMLIKTNKHSVSSATLANLKVAFEELLQKCRNEGLNTEPFEEQVQQAEASRQRDRKTLKQVRHFKEWRIFADLPSHIQLQWEEILAKSAYTHTAGQLFALVGPRALTSVLVRNGLRKKRDYSRSETAARQLAVVQREQVRDHKAVLVARVQMPKEEQWGDPKVWNREQLNVLCTHARSYDTSTDKLPTPKAALIRGGWLVGIPVRASVQISNPKQLLQRLH